MIKKIVLFLLIIVIMFMLLLIGRVKEEFNSKELKFIHITKNAGTYIEDTAKKSNINFGRFHEEYGSKNEISFWHRIFPSVDPKIKKKYDWFMVVRNPYDRILSEYYCPWVDMSNKKYTNQEINNFLIDKIKNRSKEGDHFTEQYKYLDNTTFIKIIKFENLIPELKQLYKQYNLNIDLPNKKINSGRDKKIFTSNDFNEELIELINFVYAKDFELFGYPKK